MLDRILITGAHSTGKTTLCHALRDRFAEMTAAGEAPEWTLVEETARSLMKRDGWTREDVGKVEFQQALRTEQLWIEISVSRPYVADRCILDPIAYTALNHPSSVWLPLLHDPDVQGLLTSYRSREKTLIVHLLPVPAFSHDDGVRAVSQSPDEWWALTKAFERVLEEAGVEWVSMDVETQVLQERVDKVVGWMRHKEKYIGAVGE
ncbi:hypothetical protein JCM10207_006275 [Rhodosporidiobolus poonsookiae]